MFEDDRIKILLAKVRKLVCCFSLFSNASKMLNKIQTDFDQAQTKEKALLLVQNVDTRWISTYFVLQRLKKLK